MAYVSKIWVDRQTEYPTRRKLEFDDGSSDKIVTVSREEGTIYAAGDTFDANTMNSLESRIAAGIAEKQDILIPGNGIRIDQDNVISATGGGGGIEFTKIESGSLVSVNDAADLPVVDLAVEIKAVQSGTGDPSPLNVRPISGWTGANIVVSPTQDAQDGTTYPVTWQTEAGTVFGGSLDVTSGVLKITHEIKNIEDINWQYTSFGGIYVFTAQVTNAWMEQTTKLLCSCYKQTAQNSASNNTTVGYMSNLEIQLKRSSNQLYIMDNDYTDATLFKTARAGQQIIYPLATPVTVQLTPTEIETILGINNIWADTGEILNLEYYTTSASDVRDFIIKDDMVSDQSSWSSDKITEELDTKQDIIEAGDGIVINGNEISAVLYKELTATLNVFSTSVVFEDSAITTNSVIDIYTSKYAFNPETVSVETGKITITFRQPEEQIYVKVRIS